MKQLALFVFTILSISSFAQVKIGSAGAPNGNAVLELDGGTTKGFLLPRIATTDMNGAGFSSAPNGLLIFNSTDGFLYIRKANAWQKVTDATNNSGGGFSLPYAGSASTVGGAEFSITHTTTFGDAAYFHNTAGGLALTTGTGNNKLNITSGNTGIGIPAGISENPTLGRLVVRGTVGAVSAMFGDNAAGVSVMNNLPSIGFNYFFSGSGKSIVSGFGGQLGMDQNSGNFYILTAPATVSGSGTAMPLTERLTILANGNVGIDATNPAATLQVGRGNTVGGTAQFDGTTNSSHFNYDVQETTFIRGGKATSQVVINDVSSGNVRLVEGGGNVGIGVAIPPVALSFPTVEGKKISLYRGATGDAGFGVFPNELRIHSDYNGAATTIGYDNLTNGFKETFRVNPNGNIIITNPVALSTNVENATFYKTSNYYTGAIKAIGDGSTVARLGFFAYASANSSGLKEYLSITDGGNVGVGITNPQVALSFATVLGKKISMYRGASGDAGFGVFGNELRVNSDNVNADITFGYDNLTSGFLERMRIKGTGEVCIGTNAAATGYRLNVNGKIIAEEVKVQLKANWPDYVFSKNYNLQSLGEVENFIAANNHLPNVPAAAEVEKSGIALGEMQSKMMEKIEELTLYIIQQKKIIDALNTRLTIIETKK